MTNRTAVVVVSGGMDSVTLAYDLADAGYGLHLLSFDYGQRHVKEIGFARRAADRLGARHDVIDLSGITHLIDRSALTGDTAVPDGHYAEDNMTATVVPNRNMMMLSIAAAVAVNDRAVSVETAVHGGDHFIYPDCRPEFIIAVNEAVGRGNDGIGHPELRVRARYVDLTKDGIVKIADRLGLDLGAESWSCYKGGENHCGRCGTCVERAEAFWLAGVTDTTVYDDEDYWATVVKA